MTRRPIPITRHISLIYRYAQRFLSGRLRDFPLEAGQLPLMLQLYRYPGVTQEQLAQRRVAVGGARRAGQHSYFKRLSVELQKIFQLRIEKFALRRGIQNSYRKPRAVRSRDARAQNPPRRLRDVGVECGAFPGTSYPHISAIRRTNIIDGKP